MPQLNCPECLYFHNIEKCKYYKVCGEDYNHFVSLIEAIQKQNREYLRREFKNDPMLAPSFHIIVKGLIQRDTIIRVLEDSGYGVRFCRYKNEKTIGFEFWKVEVLEVGL